MTVCRLAMTFSLMAAGAFAEDALVVAPQAYKLQSENEWVKVVRVRYAPHERIPAHDHNPTAAACVYLNDGGPVVFNHLDQEYGAVTRAATKAGSFRISFGIQELHEVVNTSPLPSEFLRVEFKTEPKSEMSLKGRFVREPYPEGENVEKIHFDNEQVRITRLIGVAGSPVTVATKAEEPALLVALADLDLISMRGESVKAPLKIALGHTEWVAANQLLVLENAGSKPAELLRFDFKTRPLTSEELRLKTKKHEHGAGAKAPAAPATFMEEVTVTAERRPTRVSDTVASLSVVSRDDLKSVAAWTLDDSLRQIPGFSLFRRSGSRVANPTAQGVSLRGVGPSGASRAAVLSDGIPLNDPFGGWVYWGRTPRLSVERVEVVRGGASSLYGTDALGGVINLIPRETATAVLSADVSYGGQDSASGSMFAGRRIGPVVAQVSGELLHAGGYVMVDEGQRGRVDTKVGVTHKTLDLRIATATRADRRAFMRGTLFDESRKNGTPLQINDTSLQHLSIGAELETPRAGRFGFRSYIGSQTYNQTFSAVASGRNSESLTRRQRTPAHQLGGSLQWSRHAGRHHSLVSGIEFKDVRGHSDEVVVSGGRDTSAVSAGGRERMFAVFAQDTIVVGERLLFTLGARADRWRNLEGRSATTSLATTVTAARAFSPRTETAISPRLGVLYRADPSLTLTASAYRAFRAPTLNELYRSFRVGSVVTQANDGLLAERLRGGEVGARLARGAGRLLVSGSLFWSEIEGPVANVTLQSTPDLITRERRNLGRTRSRGVEMEGEFRVAKAVSLNLGYLLVDSTVMSFSANRALEGLRLPQVTRHQATVQARYSKDPLTFSLQGRVSGAQFDDDLNQLPLGRYLLLDLFASRRITRSVEIFAAAENVLDRRYEVGRAGVTTLGAPRLARAGLRLSLGAR